MPGLDPSAPDAGVRAVETEHAGNPFRGPTGEVLDHRGRDVVANQADMRQLQGVEQPQHVGRKHRRSGLVRLAVPVRLVALAEAAEVGRQQVVTTA